MKKSKPPKTPPPKPLPRAPIDQEKALSDFMKNAKPQSK